jgi:predicted RNA-binding protein YlxR (DUF448 family)
VGKAGEARQGEGRHEPVRTCVACRQRRPQRELLRIVRRDGGIRLDPLRRLEGRGAYVCPDRSECREAKRLKRFARGEAEALAASLAANSTGGDDNRR